MNSASADVGLAHTEIVKGRYELTRIASIATALGAAAIALAASIGECYAKYDPPTIILAINPATTGDAPDSQED